MFERKSIFRIWNDNQYMGQWVWNLVFKRHRIVEARVVDVYKAGCRIRGAPPPLPFGGPSHVSLASRFVRKLRKHNLDANPAPSLCFQPLSTFVWSLSVCAKPVNCVRLGLVMCCALAAEKWLVLMALSDGYLALNWWLSPYTCSVP